MENQVCPENHLVKAILVTIFCCLPLGIIAIIKASSVNSLFAAGNVQGAYEASKSANRYSNIAIGIGLVTGIINAVLAIFAGGLDALAN